MPTTIRSEEPALRYSAAEMPSATAESRDEQSHERHAQRVLRDGYTILHGAIAPELVRELREVGERLLDELGTPYGANDFLGERTRRIFNLLARDPVYQRVPVHEAVLPIVERVLDSECLLSSLTAIRMEPGETEQPIHADDGSVPLKKPHSAPIACVATWALSDFSEQNGGTRIVPASHLRSRGPKRGDVHETIGTVMPAGSVLIYHGSLWHGGGANRSDAARCAIVCNYCAGFMRQEESQLLALPPELVASFAPRLRSLVGYGTYRGLLGHVDQRDPASRIDPEVATDMVWSRIRS